MLNRESQRVKPHDCHVFNTHGGFLRRMINRRRYSANYLTQSLLGRVLSTLAAAAIIVCGFFFAIFALIAAAIFIVIVLSRLWWVSRKLRAQRHADVIEGEYTIHDVPSRQLGHPPDDRTAR